jgi:hypothetical protein
LGSVTDLQSRSNVNRSVAAVTLTVTLAVTASLCVAVTASFAVTPLPLGVGPVTADDWEYHKLRHSHASMLIAAGGNLKTIQERLGHSSIAVTIDLYGHLTEGAQATAAARLDCALGGALKLSG